MMLSRQHLIATCFVSLLAFVTAFVTIANQPTTANNRNRRARLLLSSTTDTTDGDAVIIRDVVGGMTSFFGHMIDVESGRFYALCFPPSGERSHQHNPIRDLAAAWDAGKGLLFSQDSGKAIPQRGCLATAICRTIQSYQSALTSLDVNDPSSPIILDSEILKEPSNIAHSALLILATTVAMKLSLLQDTTVSSLSSIDGLTRGILSMQRQDGAFCVDFDSRKDDNNVYRGIEFYPGEAMVALMHAYESSSATNSILKDATRQEVIPAMQRAFSFYSGYYHQGDADINYNIWQAQAFSLLFKAHLVSGNQPEAALVATYVLSLCEDVINSKSWKYELARGRSFYPNLNTVEISCGLDALADGIHVARITEDERLLLFEKHASNAVVFLQWIQDQVPVDVAIGRGGLGYGGLVVLEQRLDVTGHAISALTKLPTLKNHR